MDPRQSVLVVDQSEETREVLRSVLEPRGMVVLEATAAEQGLAMAQSCHPDLIVLDGELEAVNSAELTCRFALHASPAGEAVPLVLLGSARRMGDLPCSEYVAKPYHYGPLIRKIEELLAGVRQPAAQS